MKMIGHYIKKQTGADHSRGAIAKLPGKQGLGRPRPELIPGKSFIRQYLRCVGEIRPNGLCLSQIRGVSA
ncbi:hypothetical protein DENIS_3079 [Desulfonema ishimotonii]|uniref:Uncharacterized protein n=1 Tax=Desulfonema ishimotonii TaxID=45657 RepID=A0A401FYV0_9BACT|nr:hypothetical protein DENIS_3079 [Desulfonema ishimotonii]